MLDLYHTLVFFSHFNGICALKKYQFSFKPKLRLQQAIEACCYRSLGLGRSVHPLFLPPLMCEISKYFFNNNMHQLAKLEVCDPRDGLGSELIMNQ